VKFRTPRLEINLRKIEENATHIINLCHEKGIEVAGVTKVVTAHKGVVNAFINARVDCLADSRLENLQALRKLETGIPLMLLRIPSINQVQSVVELADISLNSSMETIKQLSLAATALQRQHKIILMVDLGDLREGVWPDRVIPILKEVSHLPAIEIIGLGCNLMCYGGVIPTHEKMQLLVDLRELCRRETGLRLPVLSGGNSANLPLVLNGDMPPEINQLRIGETILLGCSVIDRSPWPGTQQDTFKIVAEVVELERKPSIPIGLQGQDAFGGTPQFVDRGYRQRAICNIGRQDVVIDNLQPEDSGIIILGGSSDHLILDVEDATQKIALGQEISFIPGYAALLAANTSKYVRKVTVRK